MRPDDEDDLGRGINRWPAGEFDEPDTFTLEQYHRWQLELPLFDDIPWRPLPQTVRVRDDIL